MQHLVYLDHKAKEYENISKGKKNMVIRGAAGRKLPYGRVVAGEELFFIINNGEGLIKARGIVTDVVHSDKMDKEQSIEFVDKYIDRLQLSPAQYKRWASKRWLVVIGIGEFREIEAMQFDKTSLKSMDDWRIVEDISELTV